MFRWLDNDDNYHECYHHDHHGDHLTSKECVGVNCEWSIETVPVLFGFEIDIFGEKIDSVKSFGFYQFDFKTFDLYMKRPKHASTFVTIIILIHLKYEGWVQNTEGQKLDSSGTLPKKINGKRGEFLKNRGGGVYPNPTSIFLLFLTWETSQK